MIHISTPAATIETKPHTFSKSEKERLLVAKSEIERLETLLHRAADIRAVIKTAAEAFVDGGISLEVAVGLIGSASTPDTRHDIERSLCRPVKARIKATIGTVADLLETARKSRIDQLAAVCSKLERDERGQLDGLGIDQDSFQPSPLLQQCRETHRRAAALQVTNGRAEFNRIISELA